MKLLIHEKGKLYTSLMPQKWLLCLLTLLVTFVGSSRMWADVKEWSYDGQKTSLDVTASKTDESSLGTYTSYSLLYGTTTYTSAVKMENATKIAFTTTSKSTITIGIALKNGTDYSAENANVKFDDTATESAITQAEKPSTSDRAVFITLANVEAGDHTITRNTKELGVFYIKVEETSSSTPSFSAASYSTDIADLYPTFPTLQNIGSSTVSYSSSNTAVATIDAANGSIMRKKDGTTTITATIDGSTNVSYILTVTANQTGAFNVSGNTCTVNAKGVLSSNIVISIPSITMTMGGASETPVISDLGSGVLGANVADVNGYRFVNLIENGAEPAFGTFYKFTPSENGKLSVTGYTHEGQAGALITVQNNSRVQIGGLTPTSTNLANELSQEYYLTAGTTYYLIGTTPGSGLGDNYNTFYLKSFSFITLSSGSLTFDPTSIITFVGNETSVDQPSLTVTPGEGWEHLTVSIPTDVSSIAVYNSANGVWSAGTKAGKVTATVNMEPFGDYFSTSASYDVLVKPGRREGSEAKYSVDFTQYLNEQEIQAAFGGYGTGVQHGYFTNANISNDPTVSLVVNAQGLFGTQVNKVNSTPSIRLVEGCSIVLSATTGTITSLRVALGNRGENKIRYYLNGSSELQNAEGDGSNIVTISNLTATSIKIIHNDGTTKTAMIQSIDAEYEAEPHFTESSVSYNLIDLKKSASEVPQLLGMANATYSSANQKIVRVNSDGSLVFLKTGKTSISATSGGTTVSYDITVWANEATEEPTENGTQYNVTSEGKLPSNIVTTVPYITLQYGAPGETAIVRSINGGYGVNVIGAADGNVGSIVPNSGTNPTSGTYYVFTPQLSGALTVSGYFNSAGSHSAWMYEYNTQTQKVGNSYITDGVWTRSTTDLVTNTVNVEAGKTYLLMAVLDADHENVFWLQSFKFVSSLKFDANSEVVADKASKSSPFTMTAKEVQGTQAGDETTYSVKVVKDSGSNLDAYVSGSTITINSPAGSDGGAIIVTATVTSTSGTKNSLSYVITVPYIGNHTWDLAHMANKTENKTDGHWKLAYEVNRGDEIKDPIVVLQDKVSGDNAKYFSESNGLNINTNGTSNIGLSVTTDHIDYSTPETMRAATLDDVEVVNLLAVTNATVTLPQLKKDWFVKIYLDPHTGNNHDSGCGCEFQVTNLCDLTGKAINSNHWIMSYGTQWTKANDRDWKNPDDPYAGCLIFRVNEPGDVTFNFRNNGWDKIVKIDVSNTYSSEMVLASYDSRTVDYLRWNHSWVHREKADGTDAGVNIYYNGDPLSRAENAKPIDHNVYNYLDPVTGTHRESNWTSLRGVTYTQVNFDAAKGVGNLKVISDAVYNGWTYNGVWTDTNEKYVLNRNESWIVVGKLKEQVYPYTWDFETYNMDKPLEAIHSTKLMEATVDTTYGHWGNSKQTNFLAKVKASASYNFVDKTSSVDNTWNSAGECLTEFAPAVETVKLREKYETNVNSTGTMLEQTVSGLTNGLYTVTLCANANYTDGRGWDSDLIDGSMDVAYVFANDVQVPIKAKIGGSVAQNGEYTMNVQVSDGTLHLGLAKRIPGTNWHTIQIKSLIYNEVIDDAGQGTSPFYTINDAGKKTYNIEINKPLFANGAQLTHGFEPIRETEGLGVSIDNAYFTASNRVDSRQEQVVLDGTKLQVNNTNWHVLIPSVDAGMYVFVKGAEPTATTNLENSDVVFAATTDGDVHYWKVTATGDVNLTFAPGASVKKIGVTNQVKSINKYGYASESRMLAIDHNETKKFSADVDAYFVGEYNKETSKVKTTQVAVRQHIPAYTGLLLMGTEAKNGTEGSSSYNVPLFVPAVNISRDADVESSEAVGNKMKPNTTGRNNTNANPAFDTPVVVNSIPTTETDDAVEYMNYTLSNVFIKVNPTTNTIVDNTEQGKTLQTIAFYKYVGNQQGKTPQPNLAYLHLEKEGLSSVSLAKSVVLLGYDWLDDEEETTRIEQVNHDDADEAYYTVSGVRLKSKPTTSGLYIKNGKKIYVK